jgi:hypothetical protein
MRSQIKAAFAQFGEAVRDRAQAAWNAEHPASI